MSMEEEVQEHSRLSADPAVLQGPNLRLSTFPPKHRLRHGGGGRSRTDTSPLTVQPGSEF